MLILFIYTYYTVITYSKRGRAEGVNDVCGTRLCQKEFLWFTWGKGLTKGKLSQRVHRINSDAEVRVEPMITMPTINTNDSKR